jgi:hypothetical protein
MAHNKASAHERAGRLFVTSIWLMRVLLIGDCMVAVSLFQTIENIPLLVATVIGCAMAGISALLELRMYSDHKDDLEVDD